MCNKWTVIKNRPLITQKTGCSRVTTSIHPALTGMNLSKYPAVLLAVTGEPFIT